MDAAQLADCCSIGLPSRGIELAVTITIKMRRCDVAAKLSATGGHPGKKNRIKYRYFIRMLMLA